MSINKNADHDLADYLHRRLDYIERCYAEIENKLNDDKMDVLGKIDDGEYSKNDPDVGRIFFDIDIVVANTFRYTMLVGVCSCHEEAIKAITKHLVPDCEKKLSASKKGNWLSKHIRVLSGSFDLNLAAIRSDLEKFYRLITLRNCIVHAWGKVAEFTDPAAVEDAAQHIEDTEISRDGYLVLGDQAVPEAILAAENIAEHILTSREDVSMT